ASFSATGSCVVTMSAARPVTASSVSLHTPDVATAGSGAGAVASDLGGIDCGSTWTEDYDEGTVVTLTANTAAGSRFGGWSGAGCSGSGSCCVSMSAARSVTASFVALYTLDVSKSGSGLGSVSSDVGGIDCGFACTDDYDDGTVVTLTATTAAGSR